MATCVVCSTQNAPWSLWCVRCRAHLTHPNAGRLASPGRRLAAEVLELVVVVVMVLIAFVVAESLASPKTLATTDDALPMLVFWAPFPLYFLVRLALYTRGTSIGKALLGMHVVKTDGSTAGFWRMLFRESIGKWVSGLLLSIGFFWILFDGDRQGWHDKLAGTYVVKKSPVLYRVTTPV